MTNELRTIQLERQLIETRTAAVKMMLGLTDAIVKTPEGREELAQSFAQAAETSTGETARLARLVSQALRHRV